MHIYTQKDPRNAQHPTRGVISPDEFIPVLEENGLILAAVGVEGMPLVVELSVAVLVLILIGIPLLLLIALLGFICAIVGAIKASNNEYYFYPLTLRFIH